MNTLYIIGNGFDLAHEIPTCYRDFFNWLSCSNFDGAKDFINSIHGLTKDVDLWRNFEEALGKIDLPQYIDTLLEEYAETQNPEDWTAQSDSVFAGIKYNIEEQYKELLVAFSQWARSIETDGYDKFYEDLNSAENYFFTFNYTNTLEQVYSIPKNRILHIHGDAKDENNAIIVGHNHDYQIDRDDVLTILEAKLPADSGESGDLLLNSLNISFKQTKKNISAHIGYFNYLATLGIEKIIVLGHSYGNVDMPYFAKIKEVCPKAQWKCSCHTENDKQAAEILIKQLSLPATINPRI